MSVDLLGHGGLSLTSRGWGSVLTVAIEFGWQPAGTLPPEYWDSEQDPEWGGGYFSNDFQEVTDSDAKAMASALETALLTSILKYPITSEQSAALESVSPAVILEIIHYAKQGGFLIA